MTHSNRKPLRLIFSILVVLSGFGQIMAQDDFVAQPTPVMHEVRDWTLSISPNYVNHPNAYPRVVGGLNSMVFLGKYFSLNANVAAGQGYFHFGTGIIGVPAIIFAGADMMFDNTDFEAMLIWAIMLGLAFENFNIHIPLGSHLEISPYISLLRIKYIEEGYGAKGYDWNFNIVGGIRLNIFVTDRFFIAPYMETTRDWGHKSGGIWGVNGGLNAGFYFRRR
ncbi:hypothetical protein ACFLTA_06505 [Bacteroidota bacterium]